MILQLKIILSFVPFTSTRCGPELLIKTGCTKVYLKTSFTSEVITLYILTGSNSNVNSPNGS